MKCEICKEEIGVVYLEKMAGTVIKDEKGKKHRVCSACQNRHDNDKQKMLEALS